MNSCEQLAFFIANKKSHVASFDIFIHIKSSPTTNTTKLKKDNV